MKLVDWDEKKQIARILVDSNYNEILSSPLGRMEVTAAMISDTAILPQISYVEVLVAGTIRVKDIYGNATKFTFPTPGGEYRTCIPVRQLLATGDGATGAGALAFGNLLLVY